MGIGIIYRRWYGISMDRIWRGGHSAMGDYYWILDGRPLEFTGVRAQLI